MKWLKSGLVFGFIGILIHLLANFGPLALGTLMDSPDLIAMANVDLSFNLIRALIYFSVGFVLGIAISTIIRKIKKQ
jgi:membrane-anchored glycerophosphoryl diester phosphodiesterase (GDPDase)